VTVANVRPAFDCGKRSKGGVTRGGTERFSVDGDGDDFRDALHEYVVGLAVVHETAACQVRDIDGVGRLDGHASGFEAQVPEHSDFAAYGTLVRERRDPVLGGRESQRYPEVGSADVREIRAAYRTF
jgi:hypothetical protein